MQRIRFHRRTSSRRGAALIIAMIALLLVGVLGAQLARSAILQHDQVRHEEWQIQAEWLAESALDRAAATLESDPDYRARSGRRPLVKPAVIGQVVIEIMESAEENDDPRRRGRTRLRRTPRGSAASACCRGPET